MILVVKSQEKEEGSLYHKCMNYLAAFAHLRSLNEEAVRLDVGPSLKEGGM